VRLLAPQAMSSEVGRVSIESRYLLRMSSPPGIAARVDFHPSPYLSLLSPTSPPFPRTLPLKLLQPVLLPRTVRGMPGIEAKTHGPVSCSLGIPSSQAVWPARLRLNALLTAALCPRAALVTSAVWAPQAPWLQSDDSSPWLRCPHRPRSDRHRLANQEQAGKV